MSLCFCAIASSCDKLKSTQSNAATVVQVDLHSTAKNVSVHLKNSDQQFKLKPRFKTADRFQPKRLLDAQAIESDGAGKKGKRHLVVVTLESPPFVMKRPAEVSGHDNQSATEWYGYCVDFFLELIKHLPYEVTFEIYQVADNKFGSKTSQTVLQTNKEGKQSYVKTERWNGLVGELKSGKAHLALAPMAVMAERELVIDFTVPFYDLVGIQILLKKPEVPRDWFKFLTVLDMDVWLSITVAYFVTSVVIYLFDRLSPYSHKNTRARISHKPNKRQSTENSNEQFSDLAAPLGELGQRPKLGLMYYSHHIQTRQISPQQLMPMRRLSTAVMPPHNNPSRGGTQSENNNRISTVASAAEMAGAGEQIALALKSRAKQLGSWEDPTTNTDSKKANNEDDDTDDGKPDFGLRDSLWFCITSLTPQGGGEAPQNLSGRIVAGAWWLFCFIVIASYTANLAAFLTVSRLDIPIESLDDLAKQYRIKYAPVDGSAEQTYFERMAYIEEIFYNIWKEMSLNDSLSEEERSKFAVWDYPISDKYTKIWSQIQEVGMPADIEAGLGRVKNSTLDDGFALLADANIVRHAIMTDCSLKAVGDEFSRKPIALAVQKGETQLKDDVSFAVLQLINQRFMEVLREKWWTNNPNRVVCENNDQSEGISIENIGGVFIIIIAGIVLSFLVWALEKFVYKTKIQVSRSLIEGL